MGVKIEVFDLFSYFGLFFLSESVFCQIVSMPRNLFSEVSLNFNFSFSQNSIFCLKMGVATLLNFTRKFQSKTFCRDYNTDCFYYLDLHRKFELSSLIDYTVIPLFVFEKKKFPLKCAQRKVD